MNRTLILLLVSALSVGFIHTLLGPDHYLPFIVMSRARHWSLSKTVLITIVCGIGHVLSAVILGLFAISIGFSLAKLQLIESLRGNVAAWILIGFGFAYSVWGIRYALKKKKHSHAHFHTDGIMHVHSHSHLLDHAHFHAKKNMRELTPWILFIVFVLGPCEPLIPLIMYPAIEGLKLEIFLISLLFGLATLSIMLFMVLASIFSIKKFKFHFFAKYGNAMAGVIICCSGLAIRFLGL